MSNKFNMDWQSDSHTVYALNEQGVNDFSFHVQGNGRNGHDPKALQKVVSMAKAAPDMYRALRSAVDAVKADIIRVRPSEREVLINLFYIWEQALAKADGVQND